MAEKTADSWMAGALWLSLAALTAKVLSALYKVPYQNLTGDAGFYVYQQVYPLYGVALVLGTAGFPLVLAGMTGDMTDQRRERLRFLFSVLSGVYIVMALAVFSLASVLASVMGDPALAGPLRWMALPFLLIPVLAFYRGVFQGQGETGPSALSQVLEQLARVVVILAVAAWVTRVGGSAYEAGISAGAGAFTGGLAGVVILVVMMNKREPALIRGVYTFRGPLLPSRWRSDLRNLLVPGLLVSLSALALIAFQLTDALTVYRGLLASGLAADEAAMTKGIYDRSWPLIQFGAVITTVFSYAALPVVVRAVREGKHAEVKREIARAVQICLVFGSAAAVGLAVIMPEVNAMLFTDEAGTTALRIAGLGVLPGSLFMTAAVLWHAVGKAGKPAVWLLAGVGVKGLGNAVLVPLYGITGAAVASLAGFTLMAVAVLVQLIRSSRLPAIPRVFTGKLLIALGLMGVAARIAGAAAGLLPVDGVRLTATLEALTGAGAGAVVFLFVIRALRLFDADTWHGLPLIGSRLPYPHD
ncbi:polysaccharide biosynthesis protein [Salisediminibacterium selenitireducens]|uniref:Polysaccharide biosynthesis protein n=1 Tax=Bacillus selenitireducens (strain ATCC 700615 / DSM 15326 / MLS10) TaxID=439292 RepID=D6XV50_BACIE|nr:polysaccharide biosynthesis protein [Salisediminibacterium selenitireducens]ADH97608.1 polysaccharide biosynthesis protein [[Bacillus] selenitireducens MLS10]